MTDKAHQKAIWAWTMYDWANSAFATTVMAAVLPVYFSSVAQSAGLTAAEATARWGFTTALASLLAAVISPVLGAMADFRGSKKTFLTVFMVLGVTATALLVGVKGGNWLLASVLFIFGQIGFAGSLVYYDALLPHVATPEEIDMVSSRGYAMGYIGGGLLLAVNLAMIMFTPASLTELMTRLSFVTVGVWWFLFTLPLLKYVSEPTRRLLQGEENANPLQASLARLGHTFSEIRKYRDLALFLFAFWVYSNGIGTIIVMATAYGSELGFGRLTLIGTLLLVQFLAAPFAILFGRLASKMGTKKAIYLSLVIYSVIATLGYFMYHEWQFWVLGALVATVQGGAQALSRSLIGRMMPKSQSAEFYSFFAVFEKFSSILGPLLFGVISTLAGQSRLSIISLIVFFILGIYLLSRVNVDRGIQVAQAEERELHNAPA